MVLGRAKVRGLLTCYKQARVDEDTKRGQKRDARSEAKEDAGTSAYR